MVAIVHLHTDNISSATHYVVHFCVTICSMCMNSELFCIWIITYYIDKYISLPWHVCLSCLCSQLDPCTAVCICKLCEPRRCRALESWRARPVDPLAQHKLAESDSLGDAWRRHGGLLHLAKGGEDWRTKEAPSLSVVPSTEPVPTEKGSEGQERCGDGLERRVKSGK